MTIVLNDTPALITEIRDAAGVVRSRLDFGKMTPDHDFNLAFRNAFMQSTSHLSLESQRQRFRCCRKFGIFLHITRLIAIKPLPSDITLRFRDWLELQILDSSTKQNILNAVICILTEMECNGSKLLAKNLSFDVPRFRRVFPVSVRKTLTDQDLRKIWDSATRNLDACAERIADGRRRFCDPNSEAGAVLRALLSLGNGRMPPQDVVSRSRNNLARRVQNYGGLKKLSALLFPTTHDCLVAYLCMLIQTGGNPYAIYGLSTDCIRPHALRSDVEWLVWLKERSKSEQKVDSVKARTHSPTNLARLWLTLTEPLRPMAALGEELKLYIAMTQTGPRRPCFQLMHLALDAFVKENGLPSFDFKEIRSAEADLIYQKTHDIREVQIRLNHRDLRTTARYLRTTTISEQNSALISKYQGMLVRLADRNCEKESEATADSFTRRKFSTVFGFDCKDPFSGIAEGSRRNELCMSFQRCATCPGAIVPLDDVFVIARLLSAQTTLLDLREEATNKGWLPRFREVYGPTLRVIGDELLPLVSPSVLAAAKDLGLPRLPNLE